MLLFQAAAGRDQLLPHTQDCVPGHKASKRAHYRDTATLSEAV
jgi:hypothetical protein